MPYVTPHEVSEEIIWRRHQPSSGVALLCLLNGRVSIGYYMSTSSSDTHYGLNIWIIDGRPERYPDCWAYMPKGPPK